MGIARDLLDDKWLPLLRDDAGCVVRVQWTKARDDATDVMKSLDLSTVDAAIACGGDGILHEMVQGVLAREDWAVARLLPLGHLPAGSGNGMSRSVVSAAREPWDQYKMSAAFLIAKGGVSPMDVAATDIWPDGTDVPRRLYSIHQIEWAVAADIDRESEQWRCLGPDRFTLQGIIRALCVRWYGGRLFLLRAGHRGVGQDGAGPSIATESNGSGSSRLHTNKAALKGIPETESGTEVASQKHASPDGVVLHTDAKEALLSKDKEPSSGTTGSERMAAG